MPIHEMMVVKVRKFNGKDKFLIRGGQPVNNGFDTLQKLGMDCIYKIDTDKDYEDKKEEEKADLMKVYYIPLPVPYDDKFTKKIIKYAKMINKDFEKGNNVFFHDLNGHYRAQIVHVVWGILFDNYDMDYINELYEDFEIDPIVPNVDTPDKLIIDKVFKMVKAEKIP